MKIQPLAAAKIFVVQVRPAVKAVVMQIKPAAKTLAAQVKLCSEEDETFCSVSETCC